MLHQRARGTGMLPTSGHTGAFRQAVPLRAHIAVSFLHVPHASVKSLHNLRTNFRVLTEPFFIFLRIVTKSLSTICPITHTEP